MKRIQEKSQKARSHKIAKRNTKDFRVQDNYSTYIHKTSTNSDIRRLSYSPLTQPQTKQKLST